MGHNLGDFVGHGLRRSLSEFREAAGGVEVDDEEYTARLEAS